MQKVQLELRWIKDCILSKAGNYLKIIKKKKTKLHVSIVTLSTENNFFF